MYLATACGLTPSALRFPPVAGPDLGGKIQDPDDALRALDDESKPLELLDGLPDQRVAGSLGGHPPLDLVEAQGSVRVPEDALDFMEGRERGTATFELGGPRQRG